MKKIYTFIFTLTLFNIALGQTIADPGVNGAKTLPEPGLVNGQGTFSFNFQNNGDRQLDLAPVPTTIKITLNKLDPILNAGALQVSGDGAAYFDWTYNSGTHTITGTQNKVIPAAASPQQGVGGPVIFDVIFTAESTQAEATAGTGNGGNVNVQPGAGGNGDANNDNTSGYTYTSGFLPVGFGFTTASFSGGKLKVEWETVSEKDNQSFVIEASTDGEKFVALDKVNTQAPDGNSDAKIKYTYSKDWQEIAKQFGFSPIQLAVMALLLLSTLIAAKRAKKGAMFLSLALLVTVGIGCRKENKELDVDEYPTVFVKIGQINKDGTTTNYSKIVKVTAE